MKNDTYSYLQVLTLCLALISGCVLGWGLFGAENQPIVVLVSGCSFTLFLVITVSLMLYPERVRAIQSMNVLDIANQTLQVMREGLGTKAAQQVCEILYNSCGASAVAITDRKYVIGYFGAGADKLGKLGNPIRTQATKATVEDGKTRLLHSYQEVGLPEPIPAVQAAIIVPLIVGNDVEGTLKFYFSKPRKLTQNQIAIAEGFGHLISTQMAALALEDQTKLATSMELKALQSQINPHFLFNIINTIASLVRTDPVKARTMLREFAVFYRRTLENASDLIALSREVEQTVRYISLEQARFGEERLGADVVVDDELGAVKVPSFMIQPIAENSVKHAMPAEGKLTISISGQIDGQDVYLYISDDGIGMSKESLDSIMHPKSQTGLGIAVKNVNDRIKGYFGQDSYMDIQSTLGEGTSVTLYLRGGALNTASEEEEDEDPDVSHTRFSADELLPNKAVKPSAEVQESVESLLS